MKKIVLLLFLSFISASIFANEAVFEGAWFYHHNKLNRDIYLLVQSYEGIFFVNIVSEKKTRGSIGFAEIIEDKLIVYKSDNTTQEYYYDSLKDQVVRTFITHDGNDGTVIYNRVPNDKIKEIKKFYFK